MHEGLHIKYCQIWVELEFSLESFKKFQNIKSYENLSIEILCFMWMDSYPHTRTHAGTHTHTHTRTRAWHIKCVTKTVGCGTNHKYFMLSSALFTSVCNFSANVLEHSVCSVFIGDIPTHLWRWNRRSVPKCWHLNYRCRWIIQKKAHNIQNMAKVWNQEIINT
jgi:hypothetical protein